MAKTYYTEEIKELIEKKISDNLTAVVNNKLLTDDDIVGAINKIRIFQDYACEILDDMNAIDEEYEAEMAAWRIKRAAEKAAEAGESNDP